MDNNMDKLAVVLFMNEYKWFSKNMAKDKGAGKKMLKFSQGRGRGGGDWPMCINPDPPPPPTSNYLKKYISFKNEGLLSTFLFGVSWVFANCSS